MKILFCSRPAYGHLYPLMALARAAVAAGHDVEFATGGGFVAKLGSWGLRAHDVGITIDEAAASILGPAGGDGVPRGGDGRPDLEFGGRLFLEALAPATLADLTPLLTELEPSLVVYEQGDIGAAVAAHSAGIPAALHSISPQMPGQVIDLVSGDRVERLWAAADCDPGSFDVFTGDAYLDIFPTAMQLPAFLPHPGRVRMRPTPFAEPGAKRPGWLGRSTRPLVYLTLGTVVATDDVLAPAVAGLGQLDVDVLLALGSAAGTGLGALPPNVIVERFVDQPAVLHHADLVVHHGGSGTVLGALAAGTPQLVLPKGADQFANADIIAAGGIGTVLEPAQATADAIAAAAAAAIGEHRPAVDTVRAELATMPDPADALDALLGGLFGVVASGVAGVSR